MQYRHALLPLLVTSSLFLVHCSSSDDDSGNAGAGGSGGSTGGSLNTGGSTSGFAGMSSVAGTPGTGGSATGGASGTTSTGGQGGAAAGKGGSGGAGAAGRGTAGAGGSSAGAAGKGSAGTGGTPTGGMGGSGGSGTSGMGGAGGAGGAGAGGKGGSGTGGATGGGFTLTSTVITEGGMFPDMNTCASTSDSSPDLMWTAGPSGTLSYALILFDTSNSLNHWVIWDIPSSVTSLPAMLGSSAMLSMPAGAMQKAIQGNGYYGPCPSGMDHLYKFTVYALPTATLSGAMTSMQTSQLAMAVMNANPLASASLSAHSSATRAN